MQRFLQKAGEFLDGFNEGRQAAKTLTACDALVCTRDRSDAVSELADLLTTLSPDQWQDFKLKYLQYTLTVFQPAKRIRATELFGMILLMEHRYYQRIPEFDTDGHALS